MRNATDGGLFRGDILKASITNFRVTGAFADQIYRRSSNRVRRGLSRTSFSHFWLAHRAYGVASSRYRRLSPINHFDYHLRRGPLWFWPHHCWLGGGCLSIQLGEASGRDYIGFFIPTFLAMWWAGSSCCRAELWPGRAGN